MATTKRPVIPEGPPLLEALREFCPEWKELMALSTGEQREDEPLSSLLAFHEFGWSSRAIIPADWPPMQAWMKLLEAFRKKLEAGELVATGCDPRSLERQKIPSEILPSLALNVKESSASGERLSLIGIRVCPTRKMIRTVLAPKRTREWILKEVASGWQFETKADADQKARRDLGPYFHCTQFRAGLSEDVPMHLKQKGRPRLKPNRSTRQPKPKLKA